MIFKFKRFLLLFKIIFLASPLFLLVECSRNTQDIETWAKQFTDRRLWKNVDWSKAKLATLGKVHDEETNQAGITTLEQLNNLFDSKESDSKAPDNLGSYYDTGIIYHGVDSTDGKTDMFSPYKEYSPSSFLRADLTKGKDFSLYYRRRADTIGLVFKPLSSFKGSSYPYMYACGFANDADSDQRYFGCDDAFFNDFFKKYMNVFKSLDPDRYKRSLEYSKQQEIKDPRHIKEIDALWKAKKSIDTCKLFHGINSFEKYKNFYSQKGQIGTFLCSRDGSKEGFRDTTQLYKETNTELNEVEIRPLGENDSVLSRHQAYRKSILAIVYLNGLSDSVVYFKGKWKTKSIYLAPSGKLKKYNLQLEYAQRQQKIAKERYGMFFPIVEFNVDESAKGIGAQPFHFYLEDQVVSAN